MAKKSKLQVRMEARIEELRLMAEEHAAEADVSLSLAAGATSEADSLQELIDAEGGSEPEPEEEDDILF